ncbi:MAG: four helix bundle suffix domain-containing protein [Candidatus Cloacimonetes bacterium]|nr:four helix bundle suffix domain-containing protein [Candidatus Cloacimonadota bacterium]
MPDLIPKHGGYRKLKSFQIAQLVFDITVRFCERYIDKYSRTRDQMVQAARSGVQNIAEGSEASATSRQTELKLTQVARSSLEELKLDYEDFLRQKNLNQWQRDDPLRQEFIDCRCQSADQVADWIIEAAKRSPEKNTNILYPEYSANAALTLVNVAGYLLDRQIQRLARDFQNSGGFSERMHKARIDARKNNQENKEVE